MFVIKGALVPHPYVVFVFVGVHQTQQQLVIKEPQFWLSRSKLHSHVLRERCGSRHMAEDQSSVHMPTINNTLLCKLFQVICYYLFVLSFIICGMSVEANVTRFSGVDYAAGYNQNRPTPPSVLIDIVRQYLGSSSIKTVYCECTSQVVSLESLLTHTSLT